MSKILKRTYKDTVFKDLFGQDFYRVQLLQALHPEMKDIPAEDVKQITLKQVITNHPYNDLSLLVKECLMILLEVQSTWSVNILLRIFLYLADTILEYLCDKSIDIHDQKQIRLPEMEFYVIYTGKVKVPETISLRNDFFHDPDFPLDLQARVITAETDDIIGQYISFCHIMDAQIKSKGNTRKSIAEAVIRCEDQGILTEYLKEREKEVIDIMIMLFDQDYALEQYVKSREENSREKGREEERKNTEKERMRADALQQEVLRLKQQVEQLSGN